jgi:hypothetical protein
MVGDAAGILADSNFIEQDKYILILLILANLAKPGSGARHSSPVALHATHRLQD